MAQVFMDNLIENLKCHFPEIDIITAMKITDTQFLPTTASSLASYMTNDLEVLLQHCGAPKIVDGIECKPPVDADACKQEFPLFKQLVFHSYSSMSIHELWKVIAAKHPECFQAILSVFSA